MMAHISAKGYRGFYLGNGASSSLFSKSLLVPVRDQWNNSNPAPSQCLEPLTLNKTIV